MEDLIKKLEEELNPIVSKTVHFTEGIILKKEEAIKLLTHLKANPVDLQVIKQNGGFVIEGELINKNVTHEETILKLENNGEEAILILPRDLDDFVKIGSVLKITIEEC